MSTASSAASDEAMEMASDNSSSSVESPATGSSSTKRTPVSPEGVLLHPLSIQNLPAPKTDEALFLPADAERTWYTGFVKPWNNFHKEAYTYWRSAHLRGALDEVRSYRFTPPVAGTIDAGSVAGPNILHTQFSRETLQGIQKVYTLLMSTQTMRQNKQPNKIWLGDPEDEDLNNAESAWKPSYVVKASRNADDETTRILGQVEYLGGRLGALTWAVSQQYMNSWGSLRCVLGDIAQYMLKSSNKHAFLVSADEVMFLKFELIQKVHYDVPNGEEPKNLFIEPWLHYSSPIKFGDLIHEAKGTISVKVALMYLLHCSMQEDYALPMEMGNAAKYKAKTKAGAKWVQKLSWKIGERLGKY